LPTLISDNEIGFKGAEEISKALKSNCSLIELRLTGNNLGRIGWNLLSNSITFNFSKDDFISKGILRKIEG